MPLHSRELIVVSVRAALFRDRRGEVCGQGGIPGDSVPVSGPPPISDLADLSEHPQLGLFVLSRLTCPVLSAAPALCPGPLSFWSPLLPRPHSCLLSTFLSLSPPASWIGHLRSTYWTCHSACLKETFLIVCFCPNSKVRMLGFKFQFLHA